MHTQSHFYGYLSPYLTHAGQGCVVVNIGLRIKVEYDTNGTQKSNKPPTWMYTPEGAWDVELCHLAVM